MKKFAQTVMESNFPVLKVILKFEIIETGVSLAKVSVHNVQFIVDSCLV